MTKDNTKYHFNGKVYGKGPLVLAVIREYIIKEKPTFIGLVDEFSKKNISMKECVVSRTEFQKKLAQSDDISNRYFNKNNELLTTNDGVEVLVNSQWGIGNINSFINHANDIGFTVIAEQDGETILSLFEKYKLNPKDHWIPHYQERCKQVKESIGIDSTEYSEEFIQDLWKTSENGVANVSPGSLSNEEYEKLLPELPTVTKQILDNPTTDTLSDVYKWAEKAKAEGKFKFIKWGVIHRVFAAVDPDKITSLLNEDYLKKLIIVLNKHYAFNISLSGNWLKKNLALKKALDDIGLKDEDPIIVNTFIWQLYVDLVQNAIENQGQQNMTSETTDQQTEANNLLLEPAKNIILYGPPGTGKTYKLQQLIKEKYTSKDVLLDESLWLNQQLEVLSWFEVVLLILLDLGGENSVSNIIEHPYFQTKVLMNERKSNIRQTAWAALQTHAISDSVTVKYEKRNDPLIFNKTEKSQWFIVDLNDEQLGEYKIQLASLKAGPQQAETVKRFEFVTFHQSYGYEEFVEGLKPVNNDNGDITYKVEPGVFKRLCKRAENDPNNVYAIVIDEINRGNISKIFGELITLIETDKRIGQQNELTLTLPYSKSSFGVPANLDIIGSMNTADRSLAHIDVALRRRFQFEELRTDYLLLADDIKGVNVKYMLFAMNQRIELLLDRDHIIGHALLMKVASINDLAEQFKTAILPLLGEYFFDDWGKIDQVFNSNGIVVENKSARSTWLGNADGYAPKTYSLNREVLSDVSTYQKIYEGIDDLTFSEYGLEG